MRPPRSAPGTPCADPTRRQQAQYLRRLGRIIVQAHGAETACELRWQEKRPYLPFLLVHGVRVWTVSTSTGWRFLWNHCRSHPVTDLSGAADALLADLGLPRPSPGGDSGRPGSQPLA